VSRFSGPQSKGAMRKEREYKRSEAEARRVDFEMDVQRVAREQNISLTEAYRVAVARRRLTRLIEAKRAGATS
jgi:hypothetical protein